MISVKINNETHISSTPKIKPVYNTTSDKNGLVKLKKALKQQYKHLKM